MYSKHTASFVLSVNTVLIRWQNRSICSSSGGNNGGLAHHSRSNGSRLGQLSQYAMLEPGRQVFDLHSLRIGREGIRDFGSGGDSPVRLFKR